MSDLDVGGLLGTVIVGGVAIKMTESIFGNNNRNTRNHVKRQVRKGKKANKRPNNVFGGSSPW